MLVVSRLRSIARARARALIELLTRHPWKAEASTLRRNNLCNVERYSQYCGLKQFLYPRVRNDRDWGRRQNPGSWRCFRTQGEARRIFCEGQEPSS